MSDDPYAVLGVGARRERGRAAGGPPPRWPWRSHPDHAGGIDRRDAPAQRGVRRRSSPTCRGRALAEPPAAGRRRRAAAGAAGCRPAVPAAGLAAQPTTSPRSRSRPCPPRRSRRCSSWRRGSARSSTTTRRTASTSCSASRSTAGAGSSSCPTPAPARSPSRSGRSTAGAVPDLDVVRDVWVAALNSLGPEPPA